MSLYQIMLHFGGLHCHEGVPTLKESYKPNDTGGSVKALLMRAFAILITVNLTTAHAYTACIYR